MTIFVLLRWRLVYNVLFTTSSLNDKHASSLYATTKKKKYCFFFLGSDTRFLVNVIQKKKKKKIKVRHKSEKITRI